MAAVWNSGRMATSMEAALVNTGNLYRINKATGASTLVGATDLRNDWPGAGHRTGRPRQTRCNSTPRTANVSEMIDATTRVDLVVTRSRHDNCRGIS